MPSPWKRIANESKQLEKEIEEFNAMREKKMSDKEDEIKTFKKDVKKCTKRLLKHKVFCRNIRCKLNSLKVINKN